MVLKISVQRQRKDTEGTRLSLGWLSWLSGRAALMFHAGAKPIIKSSSWASDVRAIGFRQWEDDSLWAPDPLRSQSRQITWISHAGFSEFQFLLPVIWESRPNGYQGPFNFQNGREIRASLFWFIHCSHSWNLKCPPVSWSSVGVPDRFSSQLDTA